MSTFPFHGWMGAPGMTRGGTRAVLPVLVALALVAASPSSPSPPLSVARKVMPSGQVLASEQRDPATWTPVPVPEPAAAEPTSPWLGTDVVLKSAASALQ